MSSVAEESAVRAIAAMAEQTAGPEVDELLLPGDYLQEYGDSRSREEEMEEMEIDESTEETEEEIVESNKGFDYDDLEDSGKGKGKARAKVKKLVKLMKSKESKPKKKPKSARQVLNELVGYSFSYSCFRLTVTQIQEGNVMVTDLLNAQTNLLWQRRSRLVELLTRSISFGSGEDADGKEYARTLETQGEAETFLHAYFVLLNDRREALFAEKSPLAAHDGRGKFKRATLAAMRAHDEVAGAGAEMINDLSRPEDQVLQKGLMEERLILLEPFQGRALKSIMVDLTNFSSNHSKKLKAVAMYAASSLRDLISSQSTSSSLVIGG
jgi:hypothetical protein